MKNIFKYFGTILTIALTAAFTGCTLEDQLESEDLGLHIKVFFPTKVVAGQPMTINGGGFSDVKEIVFPAGEEGIVVTDFQIVSNDMIRVDAPKGIAAEGGKIIVRTETEQAESPLALTLGETKVSGYSVEAGAEVEGGSQISVYGTDLEFINKLELKDEEGNPMFIEDKLFAKKSTELIILNLPKKLFEGTYAGKLYTIDGKSFALPELTYKKPAEGGGYWDVVETIIWENDGSVGEGTWGNTYRFALEGTDGNGEACAQIPADLWDKFKTSPFKLHVKPVAEQWQIRVLTGWWKGQWPEADDSGAGDINASWADVVVDNGDGTFTVTIDITSHDLAGLIDEQHILFAGQGFQILKIFTSEEVWVEGGGSVEIVKTSIWKNDGSIGEGSWGNTYRFALEGKNGGDASVDLPADLWELIKAGPFKLHVKPVAEQWQIRVLTGWWQGQWPEADDSGAGDINAGWTDIVVDNGDGTFTVTIDLSGHAILELLDEQNLLFAGQGFQILKIFTSEEVWVEGGGSVEIVRTSIWKNDGSVGAANWDGTYRYAMEGKDALGECVAEIPVDIWEKMKTTPFNVQITPAADWWQVRILDGHWSIGNAESNDISPNTPDKFVDNGDGTFTFVVDLQAYPEEGDKLVTTIDEKHLLFSGSGFIISEIYWEEEVFVPGGGGAAETVVWENDGSFGVADWSNHFYRFCLEGKDANGECAGEIAPEQWEHMKASPFKVQIQQGADWWQVRILDGHWSIGNAEANDISPNTPDKFVDNGDGTFTFEVDLQTYPDTANPLVTTVDEKHLLFAGAGFIIQKIFYE